MWYFSLNTVKSVGMTSIFHSCAVLSEPCSCNFDSALAWFGFELQSTQYSFSWLTPEIQLNQFPSFWLGPGSLGALYLSFWPDSESLLDSSFRIGPGSLKGFDLCFWYGEETLRDPYFSFLIGPGSLPVFRLGRVSSAVSSFSLLLVLGVLAFESILRLDLKILLTSGILWTWTWSRVLGSLLCFLLNVLSVSSSLDFLLVLPFEAALPWVPVEEVGGAALPWVLVEGVGGLALPWVLVEELVGGALPWVLVEVG